MNDIQMSSVDRFGEYITKGFEYLAQACKIYVETIDKDPASKAEFTDRFPRIPCSAWGRFEAVGRGLLHPNLLTGSGAGQRALERCSYSDQGKYSEIPVEVLTCTGDVLKVEVKNLTPLQVKQVFARDHVRTLGEQKAIIESQKTEESLNQNRVRIETAYSVKKDRLIVGKISFTKNDLLDILRKMG